MIVDPWLSNAETDCLRSVIGKRIHRIFSAMITVYEAKIRMLPPVIVPLETDDCSQRGFLVVETGDVLAQANNKPISVQSRPTFRMSSTEPIMPVIHAGNKHIVSGSDIDLEKSCSITKIEVFHLSSEAVVQVEGINHVIPVACDAQITFYRGEFSPFSIAASFEYLYFMRGMGLAMDTSLDLHSRLVLP